MKSPLLIVDDDEEIRTQMKWALASDYEVRLAEDRPSALKVFKEGQTPVVLLDLGLPPHPGDVTEGMAALEAILAENRRAKVIVITGQAEREHALAAVDHGAYDFLPKPVPMDELKIILKRAFYLAQLEADIRALQRRVDTPGFQDLLGNSSKMQEVFSILRRVSASDVPVLVLGESGTGKEVAAKVVHQLSARREGPFVPINCGAIPENLLESELFGYEKGAFTGANAQRKGRFEMANGGTLFLDEIGELPLALQVKLLRFLQDRQIERVGGRAVIEVDTRVVAATNRDLRKEIEKGRFREDLFYRLAVVGVHLPPLRDRGEDIPLLARCFLQRFATEAGKEVPQFSGTALRAIELHAWPGNVRELENRVRRAVIMAEGQRISAEDLELGALAGPPRPVQTLREARESLEKELLIQALARNRGKISRAAADLGVSRPTIYELMEKLGVARGEADGGAEPDVAPPAKGA